MACINTPTSARAHPGDRGSRAHGDDRKLLVSPNALDALGLNNSVTAVKPGDSAKLACPVPAELFGTRVSWIRRRDLELLAVGESMYSNDPRFFVSHSRHSHYQGARHSQVWFLNVLNVTHSDEGEYECQISTYPHTSTLVHLTVAEPFSEILGPPERVVASGSSLRLVCSMRNATSPPSFVFWYQGRRMVNYDTERNVKVVSGKDYSVLTVSSVTDDHGGNYTCEPSNASPSSVHVHVVEGSNAGPSSGSRKTPVRQLGVKSASSAGPRTLTLQGGGARGSVLYLAAWSIAVWFTANLYTMTAFCSPQKCASSVRKSQYGGGHLPESPTVQSSRQIKGNNSRRFALNFLNCRDFAVHDNASVFIPNVHVIGEVLC
ncbi:zwei Ig domain protein zig-8-like [Hyalella azteca]|uniref:Zwei Ig domain protein zig-8-like n=1 Tax=Hyalella azteca TaxID=294128 RepID=A0A979FPA0_HYAAZ|nr:zwei Ig domain protein zig-8-like [Hyalella azteca]